MRSLLLGIVAATLALLPAGPVRACIWDRDTLAMEATGLPGLIDVIVGRFERNPPLYYSVRLARLEREIALDPGRLELYDDAGVACDRLGRHDAAIEWMARKEEALRSVRDEGVGPEDHRYRWLANLGTFHAHRWLARGSDRGDLADLHRARDLIARAIARNPDAHFGRESYQLAAIDWRIDPGERSTFVPPFPANAGVEPHEGIQGLIVLGAGWESPACFEALRIALSGRRRHQSLVTARLAELHGEALRGTGYFVRARENAQQWHEHRTAFMEERLRVGRHPDTDPDFWEGYVPVPPIPVEGGRFTDIAEVYLHRYGPLAVVALPIALVVALYLFDLRRRRRRDAAPRGSA